MSEKDTSISSSTELNDELPFDLDEEIIDINSLRDPEDDKDIDWDEKRDDEHGDTPNSAVTINERDISPPVTSGDVLEQVRRVVDLAKQKGLGGHLVASEMKRFTILSITELEGKYKEEYGDR